MQVREQGRQNKTFQKGNYTLARELGGECCVGRYDYSLNHPSLAIMSPGFSLAQLAAILPAQSADLPPHCSTATVRSITTDSRSVLPGDVFLALRGDTFDGHDFVAMAIAQGAIAAIVEQSFTGEDLPAEKKVPLLKVPNPLATYQAIAHWWRNQFSIPVVAVTGSVGKTTTKEMIAAVLGTQGAVLKTQANYNNEIGVPKTLLGLNASHRYAVIEMGMRGPGEIALLSRIARPDVAVITNVGTAHIGRLGSEQAIADAKCELLAEMPAGGTAVLNHDNSRLMTTAGRVWDGSTVTYGLEGGDLRGELSSPARLTVDGMEFPLPLPGRHNALNYLAALAVAQVVRVPWLPLLQGLELELPQGRARQHILPEDVILLDETYNAGLESMIAALELLAQTSGRRRIAVLGTMKELGERSLEFHHQVGQTAQRLGLDHVLILADAAESEAIAAGAAPLAAEQFNSQDAVVERLLSLMQPGDRILLKASRAVGLDQVVTAICARLQKQEASF